MKKNNLLEPDVDLDELATITKNYTGAEIEAVCRSAGQYALFEEEDLKALGKDKPKASSKTPTPGGKKLKEEKVRMADFRAALKEIKPAFGMQEHSLQTALKGGFYDYGNSFNQVYKMCNDFVNSMAKETSNTPLLSLLLEGENGCGKTAIAA